MESSVWDWTSSPFCLRIEERRETVERRRIVLAMAHDLEDPLTSKWTCRDLPARQGQGYPLPSESRHTLRFFGENTACVVVIDSTTGQAHSEDCVLPAPRLRRTGAYQSSGCWRAGCNGGCVGKRSSSGMKHYEIEDRIDRENLERIESDAG